MKRRADEIEKKTKEVDLLNRKYEKIVAGQQGGPETGEAVACLTVAPRYTVIFKPALTTCVAACCC